MNYEKPIVSIGEYDQVDPRFICPPGFGIGYAIALVVWNAAGVVNYAGVINVAFIAFATDCCPG